jgi:hypothetical protein
MLTWLACTAALLLPATVPLLDDGCCALCCAGDNKPAARFIPAADVPTVSAQSIEWERGIDVEAAGFADDGNNPVTALSSGLPAEEDVARRRGVGGGIAALAAMAAAAAAVAAVGVTDGLLTGTSPLLTLVSFRLAVVLAAFRRGLCGCSL